jgi:tetratricopeptide (TPR) repeat protein
LDHHFACGNCAYFFLDLGHDKEGKIMTLEDDFKNTGGGVDLSAIDQMSFAELFRRGTELLHQGKALEAIPYLKQAHEEEPQDVDAGVNLAGAYILGKKFKKAVSVLEPFSEIYPDNPMIWINLGAAYLGNPVLAKDEDQHRAIAAFEHALELHPTAPSVAYNLGLIYRDRQEYDQAVEWFKKAIQHNPRDQHARNILAKLEAEEESE